MADGRSVGISRREEYAEATRRAIVAAARRLFSERGYFATKVDDIASLARVAPATVYAVSGGKQGLLRTLTDVLTTDPIVQATIGGAEELDDPAAIMRLLAATVRKVREQFDDIMRVLLTTAPHDKAVGENLALATTRFRTAFVPIVRKLLSLGALREGLNEAEAVDVLWFYFGYSGMFTLRDDNGWSYERCESWLCEAASRSLLREGTAPSWSGRD